MSYAARWDKDHVTSLEFGSEFFSWQNSAVNLQLQLVSFILKKKIWSHHKGRQFGDKRFTEMSSYAQHLLHKCCFYSWQRKADSVSYQPWPPFVNYVDKNAEVFGDDMLMRNAELWEQISMSVKCSTKLTSICKSCTNYCHKMRKKKQPTSQGFSFNNNKKKEDQSCRANHYLRQFVEIPFVHNTIKIHRTWTKRTERVW